MADRIYTIIYQSNNADALAKTAQLQRALADLDAQAAKAKAQIKGIGTGASAGLTATAKSAERLAAALGTVPDAAKKAQTSLSGLGTASQRAGMDAGSLGSTLGGLVGGMAGLQALRVLMDGFADALKDARDYAREAADANLKFKDSLRETANLSDKAKPDTAVAAAQVDLMMQTGLKPEEATRFANEFKGSIYAARTKGHLKPTTGTPEQLEADLGMIAARTAVAKGVDPGAMANLASAIAMTGPITSKEQVGAEIGLAVDNMNQGVGNLSDMTRQVLNARGSMISLGFAGNVADVSAVISGMSQNNPVGRTANRVESMAGAISKATAGEEKDKLAGIGITTETKDFIEVLRKLKPVVEAAEQPGGGGGLAALGALGITESRAQFEIVKSIGELPVYEKMLAKNREVLGDKSKGVAADPTKVAAASAGLTGSLEEFKQADTTGRFADAQLFAANFLRGTRTERLQVQRKSAAAELIAEERIKTAPAAVEQMIATGFGLQTKMGGKTGEEMQIDKLVAQRLLARARKAGLSEKQIAMTPDIGRIAEGAGGAGAYLGDERFGTQVELLEAKIRGGKVGGVMKDVLAKQKGLGLEARVRSMAETQGPGAGDGGKAAGGAGPGDGPVQVGQLKELRRIGDAVSAVGPPAAAPGLGPAPVAGGNVRVGEG